MTCILEEEEEEDNTTTRPRMVQAVNPRLTTPTPTTIITHPKCLKWTPGVSLHQILPPGPHRLNTWALLLIWVHQLLKCTRLSTSLSLLTWGAGGYLPISPISNTQVWEEAMAASSFR